MEVNGHRDVVKWLDTFVIAHVLNLPVPCAPRRCAQHPAGGACGPSEPAVHLEQQLSSGRTD